MWQLNRGLTFAGCRLQITDYSWPQTIHVDDKRQWLRTGDHKSWKTAELNPTQILVILKLRLFDHVKDDMGICWQCGMSWKQRPLRPPKTPKLENKDPSYFSGLRNYDQSVSNTTVSWALVTRILRLLLESWTDIRGIAVVLNWKTLCFVSSKELSPCLFEDFNFHRR